MLLISISPLIYVSSEGEVDIIELLRQHLIGQADKRDANTEDEEEEFDDDVETDCDEDSPQLSE